MAQDRKPRARALNRAAAKSAGATRIREKDGLRTGKDERIDKPFDPVDEESFPVRPQYRHDVLGFDPETELDELERGVSARLRPLVERVRARMGILRLQVIKWAERDARAAIVLADSRLPDHIRIKRALNWYRHGRPLAIAGKGRGPRYPRDMVVSDYRKLLAGELLPQCKDGPLSPDGAIEVITEMHEFKSVSSCRQFLRREWRKLAPTERFPVPGNV